MNKTLLTTAAIGSALTLAMQMASGQTHPEKPTYEFEKCYGVATAGQNDCFTAVNSCGGTSEKDGDPAYWVYLPKGTCEKITGGSLKPGQ